MNDLTERLRARTVPNWVHSAGCAPEMRGHKPDDLCQQAADEIERLLAALRMVCMLRQLGGMMPGSREIVQTIVGAADETLGVKP